MAWQRCGGLGGLVIVAVLAGPGIVAAREPAGTSFLAGDGVRISADYYAPAEGRPGDVPVVMLVHTHRSDRKAWEPLIVPLREAGFAVLALDLRGHGESATTETRQRAIDGDWKLFKEMQEDLRGAYDWLAKQPHVDRARFAVVGASAGASVALQYAVKDRSVDAVVCLSPGLNDFGMDAAGDIGQITGRRILVLATEDQRDAPYTLEKRGAGVEVKVYREGPVHGTDMLDAVPQAARDIVAFLKSAVGDRTDTVVYGSINSDVYHERDSAWVKQISPTNLRYYSSPREAESRGLRAARSKGPGKTNADDGEQSGSRRRRRP
jgi:dienelactone hydrolase